MVPFVSWAEPPECHDISVNRVMGDWRLAKAKSEAGICKNNDEALTMIKMGAHAEILASVITAGRPSSKSGTSIHIMSEAAKRMSGVYLTLGGNWQQGIGVYKSGMWQHDYRPAHPKTPPKDMVICRSSRDHYVERPLLPSEVALVVAKVYFDSTLNIQANCPSNCEWGAGSSGGSYRSFAALWTVAVRTTFALHKELLTEPNIQYVRNILEETGGLANWNAVSPVIMTTVVASLKGAAIIKDLQVRVTSSRSLVLAQAAGKYAGCKSDLQWNFLICNGCHCTVDGKMSLMHTEIHHKFTGSDISQCKEWYSRIDNTFRYYFALLRAAGLAESIACCSDWANGATDPVKQMWSNLPGERYGWPNTEQPFPKWRESAKRKCRGEKLTKPEAHTKRVTLPGLAQTIPGFKSITNKVIEDYRKAGPFPFQAKCTQHAMFDRKALFRSELKDSKSMSWLYGQVEMADQIVCAEKDFSKDVVRAFAPLMGRRYFLPSLDFSMDASVATVTLGCGAREVFLDSYASPIRTNGHVSTYKDPKDPKSPSGKRIQGLDTLKLDGGLDRCDNTPHGGLRYRGIAGGKSSTCCPPWGLQFRAQIKQGYHQRTNQKCSDEAADPLGSKAWTTPSETQRTNQFNSWSSDVPFFFDPNADVAACFRGAFTDTTSHCASKFQFNVFECNGCKCLNKAGEVELIQIDTRHTLMDNKNDSCNPWFTYVDAGVRGLIAMMREKAVADKLNECI
jgi:hypothetical protein